MKEVFEKIKNFLEKDPNILFALAFGSAVTGKLTPESDIDVAIYVKEPLSGYELLSLMQKLSSLVKKEVHIVVLNDATPLLRHQVMKNRKELFIKDFLTYSKFREKTIDDYQEYLDITGYLKYVEP
jgi:predicted nucleotidyltransferase